MRLSEAIKKRIMKLLKEEHKTLHGLSLDAGIPYSTLSSFINGKSQSPKLVTILHICEGFDMSLDEFFNDKLFKNVEED